MGINIRKQPKQEQEFYLNKKDEIKYNFRCEKCANVCKQSHKVKIISCPKEIKTKTKDQYLKEIEAQNKIIKDVADEIDIHTRTLKSLLTNNNRDIDFDTHKKLMKYLFNIDIKK